MDNGTDFRNANTVQYSAVAREAMLVPGEGVMYDLPTKSPLVRRDLVYDEPLNRTGNYGPGQNGNRIDIAVSCQGYMDPMTLRLNGELQVLADKGTLDAEGQPVNFLGNPTSAPVAFTKISLQAMIDILEIFQMDSNWIERIVRYGYLQTFIGQCLVAPWTTFMSSTAQLEYGITKPVSFTVGYSGYSSGPNGAFPRSQEMFNGIVAQVQGDTSSFLRATYIGQALGLTNTTAASASANSGAIFNGVPALSFSLQIICGLTQMKYYIPLQALTKTLRFRFYLNPYPRAFLDTQTNLDATSFQKVSLNESRYMLMQPPRPWNPAQGTAIVSNSSGTKYLLANPPNQPFSTVSSGTYQLYNIRLYYDRITLSDAANAAVMNMIMTTEGLLFHIVSWLTAEQTWTNSGAARYTIELTEVCRSLKAIFPCIFQAGEYDDSYQMPMPWCPGFTSYQYKLGTNYYPEFPVDTSAVALTAFQNAIGLQNSVWATSMTTAWSLGPPGYNYPAFADPFYKSPAHNDEFQNMLELTQIYENSGVSANGSGPQGFIDAASDGAGITVYGPKGYAVGKTTLSSGGATIAEADFPALRYLGTSAQSIVLLQPALVSGTTYSNSAGSVYVVSQRAHNTTGPVTAQIVIASSDSTDARDVYFVVAPKPSLQLQSTFTMSAAPAAVGAGFFEDAIEPPVLFTQPLASTAGYNIVPRLTSGSLGAVQLNGQAAPSVSSFFLGALSNQSPGSGAYTYQVTIPASAFSQVSGGNGYVATIPAPTGSYSNSNSSPAVVPVPTTSAVIARLVRNNGLLNENLGDFQSRTSAFVTSSGTLQLYLPNFALLSTTAGSATYNVLVADASLFGINSGIVDAYADQTMAKVSVVGGTDATGTAAMMSFTSLRGPWPLQWHPGSYDVQSFSVDAVTYSTTSSTNRWWSRGIFTPAWCFETDRQPNTPSGLNLNIPSKRLQLLLALNTQSAAPTQYAMPPGAQYPVNIGGFPTLQGFFFFLHDRFFTISMGNVTDVQW